MRLLKVDGCCRPVSIAKQEAIWKWPPEPTGGRLKKRGRVGLLLRHDLARRRLEDASGCTSADIRRHRRLVGAVHAKVGQAEPVPSVAAELAVPLDVADRCKSSRGHRSPHV